VQLLNSIVKDILLEWLSPAGPTAETADLKSVLTETQLHLADRCGQRTEFHGFAHEQI
jgi:hypothetical protein